jgi:hypothetical protein
MRAHGWAPRLLQQHSLARLVPVQLNPEDCAVCVAGQRYQHDEREIRLEACARHPRFEDSPSDGERKRPWVVRKSARMPLSQTAAGASDAMGHCPKAPRARPGERRGVGTGDS